MSYEALGFMNRLPQDFVKEPYVWRLRLSRKEFLALEMWVKNNVIKDRSCESLLFSQKTALATIIYIAEWYKREYTNDGNRECHSFILRDGTDCLGTSEVKQIWELSGISMDTYLYSSEKNRQWLRSIYSFGGLAVKDVLKKKQRSSLKKLCSIYHGDDELESLTSGDFSTAAFQKSFALKHSIYNYIRSILKGEFIDEDPQIQALITAIREADEQVTDTKKFRVEWIVNFPPESATMTRRLRLALKPEKQWIRTEKNLSLHPYISHERLRRWGMSSPEECSWLYVGIRWFEGNKVVKDLDYRHPIVAFSNSGNRAQFVSWGIERGVITRDVPIENITRFEIIMYYFVNGKHHKPEEIKIQNESIKDYMQLWRISLWKDDWSTARKSNHATAVIYNKNRYLDGNEPDSVRAFRDYDANKGDEWSWKYINSSVCLLGGRKPEILRNYQGDNSIYTKLYQDLIQYNKSIGNYSGTVSVLMDDELRELPVIFGRDDILIAKDETEPQNLSNWEMEENFLIASEKMELITAPSVRFANAEGSYYDWDENNTPDYGIVLLKVLVKGLWKNVEMLFLKGPIKRNLRSRWIEYFDLNGIHFIVPDIDVNNRPTIPIDIDIFQNGLYGFATIEVIRPISNMEVFLDEIKCLEGNPVYIPSILKDRISIRIFDYGGYRTFDCKELPSLFNLSEIANRGDSKLLEYWNEGKNKHSWKASDLNEKAPSDLFLYFGDSDSLEKAGLRFIKWDWTTDYDETDLPYSTFIEGDDLKPTEVLFQDLRKPLARIVNIYRQRKTVVNVESPKTDTKITKKASKEKEQREQEKRKNEIVNSFLIAAHYGIYFETLPPLRKFQRRCKKSSATLYKELLIPLFEKRKCIFKESDKINIHRLLEEFGIYMEVDLEQSPEQIIRAFKRLSKK